MGLAELERKKDEKIDGVIYDMSPAPGYQHGIINNCQQQNAIGRRKKIFMKKQV